MIPLVEPALDGNELNYLKECIGNTDVAGRGRFINCFEAELAKYVGARYIVACSSGTAALHVAMRLAGAKPGKLVAVSDFTFIASANAVSYTGADLLLVDSESRSFNMNTDLLYDEVTRRARRGARIPSVIEVVHVLGHPAWIEPLLALQNEYGILVVEDAAESLGASWTSGQCQGRRVGSVGNISCFSFNGNKIITTGGGGALATDCQETAYSARHLISQAKISVSEYLHDVIGYNYRLSNLAAAVGLAQLEVLPGIVSAKRSIAEHYINSLSDLPVADPPREPWAEPTFWLYSALLHAHSGTPDGLVDSLAMKGIEARRLWPPLHVQQPYTAVERIGGEVSEKIYRRGFSLPSAARMPQTAQEYVISAVRDYLVNI